MASSFGEAFAKSFQAEMARRRDEEARIEQRAWQARQDALQGVVRRAEQLASEKRADESWEKKQNILSQMAVEQREEAKAQEIADIASSAPYNQPFDFSGSLEAAKKQVKDYETIQEHEKDRILHGLKPIQKSKPYIITRESGPEFGGQAGGAEEVITPGLELPSPAQFAEVAEAKRAKEFADKQSEAFRADRAKRSSDAMTRDANANAILPSLPKHLQSDVVKEFNSLVPKDERGEAVGAPPVGTFAALVARAESQHKSDQQFEEYAKQHSFNERRSAEDIFEDVTKAPMAGEKISDEELRRLKRTHQYIQIRKQSPDYSETRTSYEWVPKAQSATPQTSSGLREENLGPKTNVDKLRSFREIFRGPKTD